MYKKLENKTVHENEMKVFDYWKKNEIFDKSINQKDENNMFVFYDGPATANGMPGLHHMVSKFLKDAFCRYQTMQGKRVLRKIGWDTHGLPVEVQVEKKLGFNGKKDIEKFGIDAFNKECRNIVWENEEAFKKLTNEMGQFIDLENRYITYDNNYIETEWYILKKFFDEGLFYRGQKILPYCPRCGTGLASHEVAQGYKEDTVTTVIVPFKLKEENAYFLVWTTTPWTLLANTALCVNPNETYVKVLSKGYTFILAKKLLKSVLKEDYEVIKEYKGKELEYTQYEQLLPYINVKGKAFYVTCDEYVTMDSGTGVVHIAPAYGEDDSKVGKKYSLPYVNPVGDDGKYLEGPWKGMLVFDADKEVIEYLKENDKLFNKQKMVHNYPHCWRCDSPLIYYSKPSFYLEVTKIKDKIIKENSKVNWYPEFIGEKRFANWLENMNDWAISRSRYWGTPLPLWTCECGHTHMIGSIEELKKLSINKLHDNEIDLHRPYVDNIEIKCDKCGSNMKRVPDVIDCWFDSGAMPFSQYHYPFENKELFEKQFPADFIAEGIDQTRGWFYSLLVISTFLMGKSPYKNVLVNELLLDKFGKKMHKSKGNAIEPFSLIEKYGADTIRWYLPSVSPVWTPIKFDEDGLKEVSGKFFNTFKNTYSFFEMYANADKLTTKDFDVNESDYELIDKWLLSRYNNLIDKVTSAYNEYDLTKVVWLTQDFVIDDLSNFYIRRNRKRFWDEELSTSKKAVYKTTYEVLEGICKIIAPISPFISDEVYQNLTAEESVHLSLFPKVNKKYINNKLEEEMEDVKKIIYLGRNTRENAKIKIRQPLSEIILDASDEKILINFKDIILDELNVKTIVFEKDLSKYMNYIIKPNYKVVGPIFGSDINSFKEYLLNNNINDIVNKTIVLNNKEYNIDPTYIDITVSAKEGFDSASENNKIVVLNTNITKELKNEGIVRDIIRTCQLFRKEAGFNVEDRIYVSITSSDEVIKDIINEYQTVIEHELLAKYKEDEEYSFERTVSEDISYDVKMRVL